MSSERIALVTGASQGIGLAIARALASEGYAVAVTARNRARLDAVAGELAPARALAVAADLRDPEAPERLAAEVHDRLGPIDVLVNNAGTAPAGKLTRWTDAMLDEVLDLHVKAPFRLIRAVLPGMQERSRGRLIQLASTAGLRGFPLTSGYTAAKHGMVGLTRALAAELGDGPVRAHAVCPGFVDTDITRSAAAAIAGRGSRTPESVLEAYAAMNACGRLLQPAEVAAVVVELAAPSCPLPNGSLYVLDDMPPTVLQP